MGCRHVVPVFNNITIDTRLLDNAGARCSIHVYKYTSRFASLNNILLKHIIYYLLFNIIEGGEVFGI